MPSISKSRESSHYAATGPSHPSFFTSAATVSKKKTQAKKKPLEFVNIMFFDNQITSEYVENTQGKRGNMFHWKVHSPHVSLSTPPPLLPPLTPMSCQSTSFSPLLQPPLPMSSPASNSSSNNSIKQQPNQQHHVHAKFSSEPIGSNDEVATVLALNNDSTMLVPFITNEREASTCCVEENHGDFTSRNTSFDCVGGKCGGKSTKQEENKVLISNHNHMYNAGQLDKVGQQESSKLVNTCAKLSSKHMHVQSYQQESSPKQRKVRRSISIKELLNDNSNDLLTK